MPGPRYRTVRRLVRLSSPWSDASERVADVGGVAAMKVPFGARPQRRRRSQRRTVLCDRCGEVIATVTEYPDNGAVCRDHRNRFVYDESLVTPRPGVTIVEGSSTRPRRVSGPQILSVGIHRVLTFVFGYKLREDGLWVPTKRAREARRRGEPSELTGRLPLHRLRRGVEPADFGLLLPPSMTPHEAPAWAACIACDAVNILDPRTLGFKLAPLRSAVVKEGHNRIP